MKPAFESPPRLHGTVAQDRLSDRPGHGDASPRGASDDEPFAGIGLNVLSSFSNEPVLILRSDCWARCRQQSHVVTQM